MYEHDYVWIHRRPTGFDMIFKHKKHAGRSFLACFTGSSEWEDAVQAAKDFQDFNVGYFRWQGHVIERRILHVA